MNKQLRKFIMIFFFALGMTTSHTVFAQGSKTVTGTVKDDTGLPLPGVTVQEKGTSNGAATDFDGNYSIEITSNTAVLVFSYVGMNIIEKTVGSQNTITVTMESDAQSLDEVVLIGYGSQQRKAVTTAVSKVETEDFNQGVVTSPLELINGKVAGLQITRPGGNNPNSSASIQLRGVTSITGSGEPLIVIDGIPGGNLDLLQQNDIASFDVLKDGAAAAIYGTRGTNGVILITTKKGKKGTTAFNYSTFLSREYVNSKPSFLNASQLRQASADGVIDQITDLGASTDIFDALVNDTNISQYHNFVASGGGENSTYRASIFYRDLEGIALENGREEFGVRANFNQSGFDDKLNFASSVAVNINDANLLGGGQFGIVADWNPTAPIYAPFNDDTENELFNQGRYGFYQPANGYNPFSEYENRFNQRKQITFSGDMKLSYEITPGFTASIFGSYQRNSWDDRFYRSTMDYAQYGPGSSYRGTGYGYKGNHLDFTQTIEPTVNYVKNFEESTLEVLGGYSYQYSTTEEYSMDNSGFTTDGFEDWNFGSGNAITDTNLPRPNLSSFKEDNTLIAYFSRVSYNFKERYFLQASVRHEGSSRFGANNKWATFPAISGGWLISDESFMENAGFVTNLKLRAGFGVTGNQGIPNYQSIVTLGTGGKYPVFLEDASGATYYQTYGPVKNPNPDLKWETKKELNIGLDFGFWSNKLSGAIDVYSRKTEDLLLNYGVPQPPYVQSSIYTNVGTITNSGIELALSYRVLDQGAFQWNVDFTGSYQKNELTSLSNQIFSISDLYGGDIGNPGDLGDAIRNEEGGPIGNFYGKRFAGFTDDGEWQFYKADGSIALSDEMTNEDFAYIGNGLPKYFASLSNTFRYKSFDLTVFFRGKFKYDILNTVNLFYGNPNSGGNLLTSALGKYSQISEAPQYSDYYLEKGDFVKLDNLTLGYTFNLPEKSAFTGLRIYGSARNLATFTRYSGRDPEVQDTGLYPGVDDRNFYPRTITVTAGINVNF
ncbi:SusC/RagA family TonB-linked outer membrane protein [Leeuwenhoekiella marinoflava]|uniref:TonB-linked SusC/RagA family outer membrane protein n=2 Tax=Leeuwenhoekiella marinoflava TaxID=988 RepID=A0A4Q0PF06_9FLAO|nr:SusC/RagA family TonB-linked outer membrane protein [Leeuwenhoekiella marinoflava]RXG25434.1 TonB-linked SusC/RagA family outer membrane protein [Leeuwenhoekiella marinoflava]SHF88942.1 TonB-linked outer membrane protein, SusC/RagA family [Leeuwenhoekiella marinoflava DSM 3653]